MNFLYLLEKIRVPVLNQLMLLITHLGDEVLFFFIALVTYWCVNKRTAYYFLSVGFIGTEINQFLKLLFRIPRPWVLDPKFTIIEQARSGASGYSFPSGHSQNAVGTFGSIAMASQSKVTRGLCIAVMILIPFSRMYLGVHTPLDVLTSVCVALVLVFALKPLVYDCKNPKRITVFLGILAGMAAAYLLFVETYHFPADIDRTNLESGVKNAYTLFGAMVGFLIVHIVDSKWLDFPTCAVWWAQILKIIGGIAVIVSVNFALKQPLEEIFGALSGRSIRYFAMITTAGIFWPMTFPWFSMLGHRN